jgi:putative hydrolase of the HAD superfamily
MGTPRLALFDLDNTLIDRAALFRRWALDFLRAEGRDADDIDWLVENDGDGLTPKESFFDRVRSRYALASATPELVAAYYAEYPRFTTPPPVETISALVRLRNLGWRLAIVTNGPPMQEAVIDEAGLRRMVDYVCVSATVGLQKPDPAILQLAANRCGVSLAGSWMVGDSASHDIAGALAAGINSVWITRGRAWVESQYEPTSTADSVAEAVAQFDDAVA